MMFQRRFISFILLLAIAPLGCHISNKAAILNKGEDLLVRKLDAIILTVNDLPTMQVDTSSAFRVGGFAKKPPVVDGFLHYWDGTQPQEHIAVRYCLFQSVADAEKAANQWQRFIGSEAFYEPEPNAEDVIGDATWRVPNKASIWFVKNNVLVHIMARRPKINQLTLTRTVARKIETKINAASNQQ